MPLVQRPCRSLCNWAPTPSRRAQALPLFSCLGCGSQWARSEQWTPRQADGSTHPAVVAEAARR